MKPAREYDIRYGHGLLKADSAKWPDYIVVTTPSAWKAVQPYLAKKPLGVGYNKWLDRTHLEEVAAGLPDNAKQVVGIGAGRALDHAKLVAKRKGLPLVQVPTVVSTGAIIHGFVGNWTGRVITGSLAEVDCEYVVVDFDLVLEAPERLNTAGLGDVLCGYAGIAEWKFNQIPLQGSLPTPASRRRAAPVDGDDDEPVVGNPLLQQVCGGCGDDRLCMGTAVD